MKREEVEKKILEVLDSKKIGVLSTVKGDKPHSRYMTFYNDRFTLYSPTEKETDKAEEISKNPNVHVITGYDSTAPYLEIEGTCNLNASSELKQKLWNNNTKHWIKSVDDPDYLVLEVVPTTIKVMNVSKDPLLYENK